MTADSNSVEVNTLSEPEREGLHFQPLQNAAFGGVLSFDSSDPERILELCHRHTDYLLSAFYKAHGLMVVKGLQGFLRQPQGLVEFSRLFGTVENVRQTLTSPRFFHESVEEIMVLGNAAPCHHPPPPKPPGYRKDRLPISFPEQVNWHTDQSYRRPPPDITLLLAVELPPKDQAQTLYADCTMAFSELEPAQQQRLSTLEGIHAPSWIGRSRAAVESGEKPLTLLPHQLPQRQPLVRSHPVTSEPALYICEEKQMDFVDGPIPGLSTGPGGAGAELLRELLARVTQPRYVYVHEWEDGDLLIGDNRNLLHCATWYDAERYHRLMWRTTVSGNPGAIYAGEAASWLPTDDVAIMAGMEDA